jgi:5-methyltetrahydrofolate--homocysteine methyltransferase
VEKALQGVIDSVVNFEQDAIQDKVKEALKADISPQVILNDGMIVAMQKVGQLFEKGDYFLPEMLVAAMTMQKGLEVIQPMLMKSGVKSSGKVVLGTVKGDLHDVGKNLVGLMLKGAGFEVIDLGADVPAEKFISTIKEVGDVKILALSALLTTTLPNMKETIKAVNEADLHKELKIMVGGAPLTDHFAKEIGADGYAPDASRAVGLAKSLVG